MKIRTLLFFAIPLSSMACQPRKFNTTEANAHLLSIPSGQVFLASCTKTLKLTENSKFSDSKDKPLTDEGKDAAKVFMKLSQSGKITFCSEYWVDPRVSNKTREAMIEDRKASCEMNEFSSDPVVSLKDECLPPRTGSQTLSKSKADSFDSYYRSTLSISGANPGDKSILSAGWSNILKPSDGETRLTDDLR